MHLQSPVCIFFTQQAFRQSVVGWLHSRNAREPTYETYFRPHNCDGVFTAMAIFYDDNLISPTLRKKAFGLFILFIIISSSFFAHWSGVQQCCLVQNLGLGLSLQSLYVLPMHAWVLRLPLLQSKNMHMWLIGDSKLTIRVTVSLHVFCLICLHVGHWMDYRPLSWQPLGKRPLTQWLQPRRYKKQLHTVPTQKFIVRAA